MSKLTKLAALMIALAFPMFLGCGGGGENAVVEAPPEATEEEPSIEGMTEEEYDAAMEADMNN